MVSATNRTQRAVAFLVLSLTLVGAGGGVADAAMPVPVRSAACAQGGDTLVVWQHLNGMAVGLYRMDATNQIVGATIVETHCRKGTVTCSTPATATSLIVQFGYRDSGCYN